MSQPFRRGFARSVFAALGCIALAAGALWTPAAGAAFPEKPIRIVIGFPPGGAIDIVARLIAPKMAETLKQPVVVENRPGANGALAAQELLRAGADGYTLLMGTAGSILINPLLNPALGYDAERDFTPIAQTASLPFLFLARTQLPVQSIADLIRLVRSSPDKITYGSSGTGSLPHLAGELFNMRAGVRMVHVPYKGSAQAIADLIGGQIDVQIDTLSTAASPLKSGRIKALGVTAASRSPILPDLPAVAESLEGYAVVNWHGAVVRKGTPPEIAQTLHRALSEALAVPDIRKSLEEQGITPMATTPAEFSKFMRSEAAQWRRVITDASIRTE
ncbi:MAG: Bug family tripartite tricarboxylate transporter substrate binding protein [Lautropia sp.]